MPKFIPGWFGRAGKRQRHEDDQLEAAVLEPSIPEAAQLRSQDSIYEQRRNETDMLHRPIFAVFRRRHVGTVGVGAIESRTFQAYPNDLISTSVIVEYSHHILNLWSSIPSGAGWFCERETLIDLISNYHSLDFIAEDVNTGVSMQRMKKRIAFDASCVLETEVPTTFIGQGLNWYNQRVRSWDMGRHGRLIAFLDRLLFSLNGQTTIHGIFWQKLVYVYSIACIVIDWVRIPVLVTMGGNGAYWRQAGLLMLVSVFPPLAYNYLSCRRRPDMRTSFWGTITCPIYKQIYGLVSLIGAIRSILYYIGGHNKPKTVKQMVKDGDERAFWLDPRFESNPAFLADAIEESAL
ncbi:hypothetical protein N0V94_008417 [Neodidymelliopsis sp. IMI 364377]|nr:hypothetical protein N0V94_008417 [Neodidymelliopsis sp. IMI 364377]